MYLEKGSNIGVSNNRKGKERHIDMWKCISLSLVGLGYRACATAMDVLNYHF